MTQETLDTLNVSQATKENKQRLDELGAVAGLAARLGVNLTKGLSDYQVESSRSRSFHA